MFSLIELDDMRSPQFYLDVLHGKLGLSQVFLIKDLR